ncbi:MAG: sugar ABC transporter, partial [Proteobacteria bacterium]|nr:sugar ABC transporter [Pseudomonadota bacterium]
YNFYDQQLLGKFSSTFDIEMNKDYKLFLDINHISLFDKVSKERI